MLRVTTALSYHYCNISNNIIDVDDDDDNDNNNNNIAM
jgi:hypothetical protein